MHKNKFLKAIFRAIPGDVLHPHPHDLADYKKMLEQRGCNIIKTVLLKQGQIFDYYAVICVKVFVCSSPAT